MSTQKQKYAIDVFVRDKSGDQGHIIGAPVTVTKKCDSRDTTSDNSPHRNEATISQPCSWQVETGQDGHCVISGLDMGEYNVTTEVHDLRCSKPVYINDKSQNINECQLELDFGFSIASYSLSDDGRITECTHVREGQSLLLRASWLKEHGEGFRATITSSNGTILPGRYDDSGNKCYLYEYIFNATTSGTATLKAELIGSPKIVIEIPIEVLKSLQNVSVSKTRTQTTSTSDTEFWQAILNSTEALSFNNYFNYMNWLFCGDAKPRDLLNFESKRFDRKREEYTMLLDQRLLPFGGADTYRVVKAATEAFVMVNCGVLAEPEPLDSQKDSAYFARRDLPYPVSEEYLVDVQGNQTLPYLAVIRAKLPDIPIKLHGFEDAQADRKDDNCYGILQEKLINPCLLELIWSYWQEEGMLVQTVNSITRRFQNIRAPSERDALAHVEIDPLRPLNNLLWGYVQDEQHRLSVVRRNYEYDHHYGLRLEGKAVQEIRPADSRSKFLEAFHNLLRLLPAFYKQDDDTNVKADAFPVLNALKEVHLILSQGAHNQFGDLPSTARIEMLMQQWLLARPEFREFLPTRVMVAYPEPWMDRVDAMKKLQGWSDTSVLNFRNLAVFGEQLLLSIRWGHWSDVYEPLQAFNWARFFRPQVQGYIHAYRAATGVDLTADTVNFTLPSVLLKKRLEQQRRSA